MEGNSVLATQKLVLEELGQVNVDLKGNSGKDAFFCLNHLMIALVSLLKTHKSSKERIVILCISRAWAIVGRRECFEFCLLFLTLFSRTGMVGF